MSPVAIMHSLIKFALCVGVAGGLVDLTIAMGKKAESAKKYGLVSLTDLNQLLHGKRIPLENQQADFARKNP